MAREKRNEWLGAVLARRMGITEYVWVGARVVGMDVVGIEVFGIRLTSMNGRYRGGRYRSGPV